MSSERRIAERHEVSRLGQISCEQVVGMVDCMVHDLSSSGALLVLREPEKVPNAFCLMIVGTQHTFNCVVKRRAEQMLGVKFER
ncbi:PilZ domain-containing protein [uncultured Methylobacterium sp.]|uniref:PilZ domain-containing protein n=1 Tax=uncultured Methylobacterium sp. TaxID=157278 RepID=UPI00259455D6|nr:PilZ domain-containing protein [uncultured Methylobacterium sp.]